MSPYARLEITLTLVIGAAVTAVVGFYAHWWALLPGILALALLSFYRDPPRKTPAGNGLLIAAAITWLGVAAFWLPNSIRSKSTSPDINNKKAIEIILLAKIPRNTPRKKLN